MSIGTPEMTLAELGLSEHGAFLNFLHPGFIAMDDGQDCPGGVWHLFEVEPTYAFVDGQWVSSGKSYEIGCDDSADLSHTVERCRWLRPGWSLIRIVESANPDSFHHGEYAYLRPTTAPQESHIHDQ